MIIIECCIYIYVFLFVYQMSAIKLNSRKEPNETIILMQITRKMKPGH